MKINHLRQIIREEITNAITELSPEKIQQAINKAADTGRTGQANRIGSLDRGAISAKKSKDAETLQKSILSVFNNANLGIVLKSKPFNPIALSITTAFNSNSGYGDDPNKKDKIITFNFKAREASKLLSPIYIEYNIGTDKLTANIEAVGRKDIKDIFILSRKTIKYLFTVIKMLNPNTQLTAADFGPTIENALDSTEVIDAVHNLEK